MEIYGITLSPIQRGGAGNITVWAHAQATLSIVCKIVIFNLERLSIRLVVVELFSNLVCCFN